MLEHHVPHLTVAPSPELERIIDKAEPIALCMSPVRVNPHAHPLALIASSTKIDRMEMIGPSPLPLANASDDPRRLQTMLAAHHDAEPSV
jgi:hypothetical protein